MRSHLSKSVLRRLVDAELGRWRAARVRMHLERCASCRERFARMRGRSDDTTSLLRDLDPGADTTEAWDRLQARAGLGMREVPARRFALPALSLATTVLALVIALDHIPHSGAESAVELNLLLGQETVEDVCCSDSSEDADTEPDDGVVLLTEPREGFLVTVKYKDSDQNGVFSSRDDIRSLSYRRLDRKLERRKARGGQ